MEELSLHILDVAENSITAGARCVQIAVREDLPSDTLEIEITDDGQGMDAATCRQSLDPFFTSRTVRRVGLGLPMFREAARRAGGELTVTSAPGRGTQVRVIFQHSHIDRQPLGDMQTTLVTLIVGHPEVRFRFRHRKDGHEVALDTADLETDEALSAHDAAGRARWVRDHLRTVYRHI
jgi:anti-sigma regulatory factor (Ser/Thr protein kinase)